MAASSSHALSLKHHHGGDGTEAVEGADAVAVFEAGVVGAFAAWGGGGEVGGEDEEVASLFGFVGDFAEGDVAFAVVDGFNGFGAEVVDDDEGVGLGLLEVVADGGGIIDAEDFVAVVVEDDGQDFAAEDGLAESAVAHAEESALVVVGEPVCHFVVGREPLVVGAEVVLESVL